MSDQIDTLYEQSGLDQTALTNGVTLATAGPNETITIRDIQISNPGRTLDLKIGNTTILTNTGSTSYGGTEYIGPGQSLTLTYRAGTYPPAAQTAPNVYCNTFDFYNSRGRATYYYNDCHRIANTALPWSNTSTYYGTFAVDATDTKHSNFPNYGSSTFLWVPASSTNHYVQGSGNWLYRYPNSMGASATNTRVEYTTAWSGSTGALMGACAYDGSRYIYGLSNVGYNNNSDNYWGYYLKLDTATNGIQQVAFQAENYHTDFCDHSFYYGQNNASLLNKKYTSYHYCSSQIAGQYLDGYYLVQPNGYQPYMLINTTTNTFRNLRFGKHRFWAGTSFTHSPYATTYFAKSTYGDYIIAQVTNDDGASTSGARYYTWDWWNIGPDLANPQVRNSGTFRQRYDDQYNYVHAYLQGTRDPYNPSYYYSVSPANYTATTYDIGTANNSNNLTIIDFTYGYPTFRYIRSMSTPGIGNTFDGHAVDACYIIPSLTNYSWTAPATPAFGTVDVRVAGIRSSI